MEYLQSNSANTAAQQMAYDQLLGGAAGLSGFGFDQARANVIHAMSMEPESHPGSIVIYPDGTVNDQRRVSGKGWLGDLGDSVIGNTMYTLFNEQAAPYTLTAIVGGAGALGLAGAGASGGVGAAGAAEAGAGAGEMATYGMGGSGLSGTGAMSAGVGGGAGASSLGSLGTTTADVGTSLGSTSLSSTIGAGEAASAAGGSGSSLLSTLGDFAKEYGVSAAKSLASSALKGVFGGNSSVAGGGTSGGGVSSGAQQAARQSALNGGATSSPYANLISRYLAQRNLFAPIGGKANVTA